MGYDFNSQTPIYLQIIEIIKVQIISGALKPNEKLMSVREMSLSYGVNPNTIQKALFELEEIGLIYIERTNGKFVTSDEGIIQKIKMQTLKERVKAFFDDMERLGLDKKQAIEIVDKEEL